MGLKLLFPFSKDKIDALLASRQKGKINPIRPNPTSSNSQVRLDVKGSSGAVVITDMSGRTVQRIEAKNGINDIELNAATLDNGVYFVLFFDDNKHLETQKWVVSR